MSNGIMSCARQVYAKTGKPIPAQLYEMTQLAVGPGKITPKEYFYYRLFDDKLFNEKKKKSRFIGKAAAYPVSCLVNNADWYALSADKLVAQLVFGSMGLPVAGIKAIFHRYRTAGNHRALHDAGELGEFLRIPSLYPLFCKPIAGSHGAGTGSLQGYHAETDELCMAGGKRVKVADFVNSIREFPKGFMFLEHLHPHPVIEEICGDRIASLRVVVFLGGSSPEITHVAWKIPAAEGSPDPSFVADNLIPANLIPHNLIPANLIAAVNKDSGEIYRVSQGTGLDLVEREDHPQSGKKITGMKLPHWDQVKDLCLTASTAIPGLQLQAWDIALCANGPVILEVNMGGEFDVPQVALAEGMLTTSIENALSYRNKAWKTAVFGSIVKRSFAKLWPKGPQRTPHAA